MNNKKIIWKNKNIISSVRFILVHDWDPIGIGDNPNLADEYDNYIGSIITLLRQNTPVETLASFLEKIEKTKMGTRDVNIKRLHDVAIKLKGVGVGS